MNSIRKQHMDWTVQNIRGYEAALNVIIAGADSGHVEFVSMSVPFARSIATVLRITANDLEKVYQSILAEEESK